MCAPKTYDMISVYLIPIISYLYSFSNFITSLSCPAHQTDPELLGMPCISFLWVSWSILVRQEILFFTSVTYTPWPFGHTKLLCLQIPPSCTHDLPCSFILHALTTTWWRNMQIHTTTHKMKYSTLATWTFMFFHISP